MATRDFGPRSGPTRRLLDAAVESLYGRLPAGTREALALNQRNAVERDEDGFLDSIVSGLSDTWEFLKPGGGLDERLGVPGSPLELEASLESLFAGAKGILPDFIEDVIRQVVEHNPVTGPAAQNVEAAGLDPTEVVPRAASQIATGFLYSPAFLVEFAKNPREATKGMIASTIYAFEHPAERPGDVIMALWGLGGGLRGVAGRINRGRQFGLRAALSPNPSARRLPEPIRDAVPGARGRRAVRERTVIANLRAADAEALHGASRRPVIPRVTRQEARSASTGRDDLTLIVQDEAIRAQFDQTTPAERAAFFRAQQAATESPAAARRLRRRVIANEIVAARGLVEGEPGSVRVSPDYPRLQALAEATARVSDEQAFQKRLLGLVSEETQRAHLAAPGRVFRGAEFQLENMADRFDRYSERGRQFLVGAKVRPSDRKNLGTIVRLNDDSTADVHFVNRSTGAEETVRFPLSELTPEGTKIGRFVGGAAESGDIITGQTYGPYKIDDVRPPSQLTPRVNRLLGRARRPATKRMTGEAIRSGRYGNVVKLTAREALDLARYRERLELWKEAVARSVTGAEVLEAVKTGRASLDDFIPVRVKPGTSKAESKQLVHFATDPNNAGVTDVFGRLDSSAFDRFDEVAAEADATGQIRFVHKDVGIEPLRITPRGPMRTLAGLINQAARFVTFYVGGPAYVVPNLIGQAGFALMHQGLGALPQVFWSSKVLRGVPKGVERASFRRALRRIGGTGVTRAIMDGSGPVGWMYRANQAIGEQYARILDNVWRENAVLYELRLRGYDSPGKILRLVEDAKRNPRSEAGRVIQEVHHAVNENYGAFDRLTEFEKNTVTQLVFIYPWLRASFDYAVKLPVNHPVKAGTLALGGTYANEQARQDFIRIFRDQGLSDAEARKAASKLMSAMPGIFAIGDSAVSPMSVALLSTPWELGALADPFLRKDWKRGFLGLLDVGTPAVAVFQAAMTALLDPFSDGLGAEEVAAVGSFARDYTLLKRLTEGETAWFEYSPAQAVMGRTVGSIAPRGVKGEGLLESVERDEREAAPPAPPEPRRYEVLAAKALAAADFPAEVKAHVRLWKQGHDLVRYGEIDLARRLGLMRESDPDMPSVSRLTDRQKYAVRIGVLARLRPGWLPADWREYYKQAWDSGDEKVIGRLRHAINEGLSFADVYGASIGTRIEENTR